MKTSSSFLLLFAFLLAFTTGCDDEDDMMTEDIVGTWSAQTFVASTDVSTTFDTINTSVTSDITTNSIDYVLTFEDNGTWRASGNYDLDVSFSVDGAAPTVQNQTYSSVDNQGTYTVNGDEIIINGSFFSLEVNGQPVTGVNPEPQAVPFSIANGILTFDQVVQTNTVAGGATTNSSVTSRSTWTRQ